MTPERRTALLRRARRVCRRTVLRILAFGVFVWLFEALYTMDYGPNPVVVVRVTETLIGIVAAAIVPAAVLYSGAVIAVPASEFYQQKRQRMKLTEEYGGEIE